MIAVDDKPPCGVVLKRLPAPYRRLPRLPRIGETPISYRFNAKLTKTWKSLLWNTATSYAISRRLEAEDIYQELLLTLWKLTERCDPYTAPDDFRRLARTEIKNRAIDLTRYVKAQKRSAHLGLGLQCHMCGTLTHLVENEDPKCRMCGERAEPKQNTDRIRWVDTYAHDVSLAEDPDSENCSDSDLDSRHGVITSSILWDQNQTEPQKTVECAEIVSRVKSTFPEYANLVDMFLDPEQDLVDQLLEEGYSGDVRKAPRRLLAGYLNMPEKTFNMAYTAIALEFVEATGQSRWSSHLSKSNLKQLGYDYWPGMM